MTKKELIDCLSRFDDDDIVTDEQNREIIFIADNFNDGIIISTNKPIGLCNRTGENVYPSDIDGYVGFCPLLDEDLYEFEFSKL